MQRLLACAVMALGLALSACGSGSSFSGENGKSAARVAKQKPETADAVPETKPSTTKPNAKPESKPSKPKTDASDGSNEIFKPSVPPSNDLVPEGSVTKPSVTPDQPTTFVPAGAVTKGSFTVWTTPSDPKPFENYTITIEVKLPSNVGSYEISDLSGQVIGTDGYTQGIGEGGQDFQFLGASARLEIFVPGAVQTVRDTVEVRSRVLNESQTLTLEF